MLQALRKRMNGDERGFTLIELMVVVLIIAILIAIAVPTFLRVRNNAQDRQAQANVQTAFKTEKAHYTAATGGTPAYTAVVDTSANSLPSQEPSLSWETGTCGYATPRTVCVTVSTTTQTSDTVLLVAKAANGNYWSIKDVAFGTGAGTFYGGGSTTVPTAATTTANSW